MSDKYRVKFQNTDDPLDAGLVQDVKITTSPALFDTAEEAQAAIDAHGKSWQGIYTFEIVPPYAPPAITAEMDLETRAGSPRGVESDLLGLP